MPSNAYRHRYITISQKMLSNIPMKCIHGFEFDAFIAAAQIFENCSTFLYQINPRKFQENLELNSIRTNLQQCAVHLAG
jgi:hypothetical protein